MERSGGYIGPGFHFRLIGANRWRSDVAERTVLVWNKQHKVEVFKKSRTVWIVAGDYMGKHIEVKGSRMATALSLWKDAARYRGN